MQKGIDVSQWQGDIDFQRVKAAGIEFVILREGWALSPDPTFFDNARKCAEADLPIKGIYHFSYALNVDEAIAEARYCVENIKGSNRMGRDTIVFFDFEYDTVTYAKAAGVTLGPAECNAHAKAFCETVESLGYKAGIYYNIDYYLYWYDHGLLDKYITWLADYSGDADYPCDIHQYSCTGRVDGINGDVDMNYSFIEESGEEMNIQFTDAQIDELIQRISQRLAAQPVSDYAKESSVKAVGLFSDGNQDGMIDSPQGFAKREEIAVLFDRAGILDWIIAARK